MVTLPHGRQQHYLAVFKCTVFNKGASTKVWGNAFHVSQIRIQKKSNLTPNNDQLLNHSCMRDYPHQPLLRWVNYTKTACTKTLTEILHITSHNRAHSTIKYCMSCVTFGRLAVSDSELGVDVIDFDECYCYLFTVLYCSLVLHAGPF